MLLLSARRSEALGRRGSSLGELGYSICWEDAVTTASALAPLREARCLSIASAGDNTLSLLARGAASVVAVDRNPAQLALLELKMAAFRDLSREELHGFLGVRGCAAREPLYRHLRYRLSPEARSYWDARLDLVRDGVIHAGRLERYFRSFRRWLLPLIHSRSRVAELFQARSRHERERFYARSWDCWRWRVLFGVFFSRFVMSALGRDPECFRHVRGSVAQPLLERTRRGFIEIPTAGNLYLHYILTGSFGSTLPDYLEVGNHERIRSAIDRVQLVPDSVERVLERLSPGSIDAFNLSDVAEYMDPSAYHRLLRAVGRCAAPGARVAYWNLLAPRRRPDSMGGELEAIEDVATRLHARARTFFYQALAVEVTR